MAQSWATGDYNGDGQVDAADFVLLSNNYGKLLPNAFNLQPADNDTPPIGVPSAAQPVPEPATALLVLALGPPLLNRRKRHRANSLNRRHEGQMVK